jgi:hypothetical protein
MQALSSMVDMPKLQPMKMGAKKQHATIQPANRMIWKSNIPHHVTSRKTAAFPYLFRFFH